jgi:hypothetical protein
VGVADSESNKSRKTERSREKINDDSIDNGRWNRDIP